MPALEIFSLKLVACRASLGVSPASTNFIAWSVLAWSFGSFLGVIGGLSRAGCSG